jgi:hypothetical protein
LNRNWFGSSTGSRDPELFLPFGQPTDAAYRWRNQGRKDEKNPSLSAQGSKSHNAFVRRLPARCEIGGRHDGILTDGALRYIEGFAPRLVAPPSQQGSKLGQDSPHHGMRRGAQLTPFLIHRYAPQRRFSLFYLSYRAFEDDHARLLCN